MRYCQETTRSHPLLKQYADCLKKIKQIIVENIEPENYSRINNNFVFEEEVAFDLDKVKGNAIDVNFKNYKTVDFFFAIKDVEENKKLLLVELKLNTKLISNIYSECKGKIMDSKILLFGGGFSIQNEIFVFNDTLLSERRDEIELVIKRRLSHPNAEILSIQELKANYF